MTIIYLRDSFSQKIWNIYLNLLEFLLIKYPKVKLHPVIVLMKTKSIYILKIFLSKTFNYITGCFHNIIMYFWQILGSVYTVKFMLTQIKNYIFSISCCELLLSHCFNYCYLSLFKILNYCYLSDFIKSPFVTQL